MKSLSSSSRRARLASQNRRRLLLEQLEERIPLAVRIWDGGGGDNQWLTSANWSGDIAPAAGDDLVFPAGASQATNVNNFAGGTRFNTLLLPGAGYNISGNPVSCMAA